MPRLEVRGGVPEGEGTGEAEALETGLAAAVEDEMMGIAVVAGVSVAEASAVVVGLSTGTVVVAASVEDEGASIALAEELEAGMTIETLVEAPDEAEAGISVEAGFDSAGEEATVVVSLGTETGPAVEEEPP